MSKIITLNQRFIQHSSGLIVPITNTEKSTKNQSVDAN